MASNACYQCCLHNIPNLSALVFAMREAFCRPPWARPIFDAVLFETGKDANFGESYRGPRRFCECDRAAYRTAAPEVVDSLVASGKSTTLSDFAAADSPF